jgi:hypothetical protein
MQGKPKAKPVWLCTAAAVLHVMQNAAVGSLKLLQLGAMTQSLIARRAYYMQLY